MFLQKVEQKDNPLSGAVPSFNQLRTAGFGTPAFADEKKGPGQKIFLVAILLVFFLALIFVVWQGFYFLKIYSSLRNIESACGQVRNDFLAKDFQKTSASLETCQQNLFVVREQLNNGNFLPLPFLKKSITPVNNLLTNFYDLTVDFGQLNKYFGDFYQSASEPQKTDKNFWVYLEKDYGDVLALSLSLANHQAALENSLAVDNIFINLIRKKISQPLLALTDFNKAITANASYWQLLPNFLGYDREKTYLLLFQNSSELRPTGGFWGSYGILKINKGEVTSFDVDDIYHLDVTIEGKNVAPPPPAPIAKYLNKNWFFRDANWSPDFREAAKTADYFYHLEGGTEKKFDAVIAINPKLVEDFLLYLGPIEVNGLSFDRENFMSLLQYEVEVGYQDKSISQWDRKDILEPLANKLVAKIQNSLSLDTINDVSAVFENNLKEKNILFYSFDPKTEKEILGSGFGGAILGTTGDYLNIIDANLASYKTDLYIERRVTYSVTKVPKANNDYDLAAHLKIEYFHRGTFNWQSTRYRTYTRVYVPLGSTLVKWQGITADDQSKVVGGLDIYQEFNKTVFGGFIGIEPQRGGVLEYEYILPEAVKKLYVRGDYQLIFQKQPGVENKTINLSFNFSQIPKIIMASSGKFKLIGQDISFDNFNLIRDMEVNIKF